MPFHYAKTPNVCQDRLGTSIGKLIFKRVSAGMDTRPVPCAALDGVSFPAVDQPMRSGSYAVATAPSPGSFPSTASPACTIAVQAWPTAPQKTTLQEGVTLYFPEDSTQVQQKPKRRFVHHSPPVF
jgi:hypothetical protein